MHKKYIYMFSDVLHQQYYFAIKCLPHPVTQVIYTRLKSVWCKRDMKSTIALCCTYSSAKKKWNCLEIQNGLYKSHKQTRLSNSKRSRWEPIANWTSSKWQSSLFYRCLCSDEIVYENTIMYMNVVVAIIGGIEFSRSGMLYAVWLCVSDMDTNTCAKTEQLDKCYTMCKQMCACRMMKWRIFLVRELPNAQIHTN